MTILGLLPIVTLLLLWLANSDRTRGLGERFLDALLVWGTLIVLFTEGLSLFALLRKDWNVVLWMVFVLLVLVVLVRSRRDVKKEMSRALAAAFVDQKLLVAGILAIAGITLLIALVAPPNTYDSMTYHMSRVANWVQNADVKHFQTDISRQLFMAPFAEFAILQFQLLTGGDRFANLVQWISMIGSLIAVCLIARELGANPKGQIFAVVCAATIPMGILQSTSTQTDYVVTVWLACLVYFVLIDFRTNHLLNTAKVGIALSLGILTKSIAYIFAFPFMAWFLLAKMRNQPKNFLKVVAIIGTAVLILNAGHYYRNFASFGSIVGPPWIIRDGPNNRFGVDVTLSNMIRNVSFHLGPTSNRLGVSDLINNTIHRLHELIGIDVNDPSTTKGTFQLPGLRRTTHEDSAGNPLHFMLGVIIFFLILLHSGMRRRVTLLTYVLMIALGFVLLSSYLQWSPYRQRYHLPLFVLMAPAIGIGVSEVLNGRYMRIVGYGLLISALPWLVTNSTKPLYPIDPFSTRPSILTTDRVSQYFSTMLSLENQYREAVEMLKQMSCRRIGLVTGENDWEYPLWVLLKETGEQFTVFHPGLTWSKALNRNTDDICVYVYLRGVKKMIEKKARETDIYQWEYLTIVRNPN